MKGNQYLTEMLNYVLDAGAYWTNSEGKPAMDTPEMATALQRWKTVLNEGLTPMDLPSGDTRQLFIEGRVAMKLDGPWVYGVMRNAAPEVLANLRLAKPPFDPPIGGSSNVIGMPSEISDEKKQLVWEFIELVTSQHFQERFSELGAMPAPRPGAITQAAKDAVTHFDLLIETQQAAAQAGVDRIPLGLEVQFNEFAEDRLRRGAADGDRGPRSRRRGANHPGQGDRAAVAAPAASELHAPPAAHRGGGAWVMPVRPEDVVPT